MKPKHIRIIDGIPCMTVTEHEEILKQLEAQEPVAWLQIGLAPLHDGVVIARTTKPKKWNPEWWRFEPLYTAPPEATTGKEKA